LRTRCATASRRGSVAAADCAEPAPAERVDLALVDPEARDLVPVLLLVLLRVVRFAAVERLPVDRLPVERLDAVRPELAPELDREVPPELERDEPLLLAWGTAFLLVWDQLDVRHPTCRRDCSPAWHRACTRSDLRHLVIPARAEETPRVHQHHGI
jgi:hypothetical protein